jgi:hypothetical protein
MSASYNPQFNTELNTETDDPSVLVRAAARNVAASAVVVNRTHRVVRHRATAMRARRSYLRSLLLPLALCSVLLALAGVAVWTGLYQYQVEAAEAVQDVASLATTDANDHLLVALLWFVPVSLAVIAAVWVRHSRNGRETTR